MTGRVGIVVIGRNEGERLAACLAAAAASGVPIVYADSASNDGSQARAVAAGATLVELGPAQPMNAARGRREGAGRLLADHPDLEYVQFIDGDCVLQSGWIERATAFLDADPRAAAVCGRRFEAHPEASPYNRLSDREWDTPIGETESVGGDSLMRVAAYRAVDGYDPTIVAGEEPELCARLRAAGWSIWRIDAPMTEHDMAMVRLSQWIGRSRRGGLGYAQVWRASGGRLFGRQLRSALLWAVMLPLIVVLVALASGQAALLLLIPLSWGAQVARLAARRGVGSASAWQDAALLMVAKGGEAVGALTVLMRRSRGTGRGVTFGLPEAVVLSLVAMAIACFAAWRSLGG